MSFLTVGLFSFSQDSFESLFFGEEFSIYIGKELKVRDNSLSKFRNMFYLDFNEATKLFNPKVAYPIDKDGTTSIDSLLNRVFTVSEILSIQGEPFSGSPDMRNVPIFVLKDVDANETIYFRYNNSKYYDFPFLIGGCDFNCFNPLIKKNVDDFSGEIEFKTPFSIGQDWLPFFIIKSISKGKTTYYLKLTEKGSTLNVAEKGVYILFEDGSKIEKPNEKINVKAEKGTQWEYSAFISLTSSDLVALKTKKIKKYRLYIHDKELSSMEQSILMMFANAISEIK